MPSFDPAAHASAMRCGGFWPDRTIDDLLIDAVRRAPDKVALVADRADRADRADNSAGRRISFQELDDLVGRSAAALRGLGVGSGDVVAVQLPNGWEFVVASLACGRIGAVVNPLMPIFRERELNYMLGFAEAKVLVVPRLFRGFDHEAMANSLKSALATLKHVIVVDGQGDNAFDRCLLNGSARVEAAASGAESALRPDATCVLMFTSGTTGSPKGVMHTTNTLLACDNAIAGRFGLVSDDVLLACSPLGHMTGYAAVMMLGIRLGATVVLQDV